ncbi:MAG: ComEC/Rec2 family competence protein [Verrucomicrobia bacterium]|nr:ComEC/Rec2 family competence protein [Verrucomicrobiota bacterium]
MPILVVLYMIGVILGRYFDASVYVLAGFGITAAVCCWLFESAKNWALVVMMVCAGWMNFERHTQVLAGNDLRTVVGEESAIVDVEGELTGSPETRRYEDEGEEVVRTTARIAVRRIRFRRDWISARGEVVAGLYGELNLNRFYRGREVRVNGVISRPSRAAAPGLFDYRNYLKWEGIHYVFRTESQADWKVADESDKAAMPYSERFLRWGRDALSRGVEGDEEILKLRWAMALGWRACMTKEMAEPFRHSGTMHVFAISGLHVGIIAGILTSLLTALRVRRELVGVLAIPLLWFYVMITGYPASAVRATVMVSVVLTGWALRRPADLLNSLAMAAFLILVYDPRELFKCGFQLSFCVVTTIALLWPAFDSLHRGIFHPDPLLPEELRPWWQRLLDIPVRYVIGCLGISLAAWIGSMPLIMYYFNIVTPISLAANMVIVPTAVLAISSNMGALFCAAWFPWACELFNNSGWLWTKCLYGVSKFAAGLDGGHFFVSAPGIFEVPLIYAAAFAALFIIIKRGKTRKAAAMILILICGWLAIGFIRVNYANASITVLAVPGGDAIYVDESGFGNDWLIDTGDERGVNNTVIPFLRANGLDALPLLVLSHGDVRHVEGTDYLFDTMRVREVRLSPIRFRSSVYRRVREAIEGSGSRLKEIRAGDGFRSWKVLHPDPARRFSRADDNALVMKGDLYGSGVLLISDLSKAGQWFMLEEGIDLESDILVTGVPSDGSFLVNQFLDAVDPEAVIVSSSYYPYGEYPDRVARERLRRRGIPVLYTADAGAVSMKFRRDGWSIRAMDGTVVRSRR